MTRQELYLLLLLTIALALSQEGEEPQPQQQLVMYGGDQAILVCSNGSLIKMVWSLIRAETEKGEECRLLYPESQGFESNCSSRVMLQTYNQTVSSHLSNLTPKDSGSYTCQCSFPEGVHHLHLNLTIISDPAPSVSPPTGPLAIRTAACSLVVLTSGVLLLCTRRKGRQRSIAHSASPPPRLSARETSFHQEAEPDYSTLHNPDTDDYQRLFGAASITAHLSVGGAAASEENPGSVIYEDI